MSVPVQFKRAKLGVDLNIISPFFNTKYFIDFYLANFKNGFMYYFSTRIQKENKNMFLIIFYCLKTLYSIYSMQ